MTANPFFQFIDKIGNDSAALEKFNTDPAGTAKAAGLTHEQRDALLSRDWHHIEAKLVAEDPKVRAKINPIGWNQKQAISKIKAPHHAGAQHHP